MKNAYALKLAAQRTAREVQAHQDGAQFALNLCAVALNNVYGFGRERVEQVWKGGWEDMREAYNDVPKRRCSRCKSVFVGLDTPFCEICGAPMSDEAVEMVMERLEVLKDG